MKHGGRIPRTRHMPFIDIEDVSICRTIILDSFVFHSIVSFR